MTVAQKRVELEKILQAMCGLPCWHVSCGDSVGASFQLALGKRIARTIPLNNPSQPIEYQENEGEANLLVWCAWRLDAEEGPVTSSDDTDSGIQDGLNSLIGVSVVEVEIYPPCWDMVIHFSNRLHLRIFCDHVPGEPSIDGNWDFFSASVSLFVGPGSALEIKLKMLVADNKGVRLD